MFTKAVKNAAKLRMSIAGPSGSGKTYTALLFACELSPSGSIAVVDTEHGSASKYADTFGFDVVEMTNFHPNNYVKAIKAAVDGGYEVVVLDSISHAWNGPGGILSIVNQNFGNWKNVAPIEQAFIEAIVGSPIHIIATMRAKVQYEVEKDPNTGKATPKKVGMGAIQRDGMEYEFDIAAMMDIHNTITIEKTRCPAIHDATSNRPDGSFMKPVIQWLGGTSTTPRPTPQTNGNGKHPQPVHRPPVPTAAELDAAVAQSTAEDGERLIAYAPTPDEALRINAVEIIDAAAMKTPADAKTWAVKNGYRTSEQSAATKWAAMVNEEFEGKLTMPKMRDALLAYVELCLIEGKKQPVAA